MVHTTSRDTARVKICILRARGASYIFLVARFEMFPKHETTERRCASPMGTRCQAKWHPCFALWFARPSCCACLQWEPRTKRRVYAAFVGFQGPLVLLAFTPWSAESSKVSQLESIKPAASMCLKVSQAIDTRVKVERQIYAFLYLNKPSSRQQ